MKFGRLAVAVLGVGLFAASCSNGGGDSAVGVSGTSLVAEDGTSGAEFTGLWEQYLETYDAVVQDGVSVSGLEGVASVEAISGLEAFSAANAVKVEADDFDAIVEVVSSMNPVSLKSGSSPVLEDCTTHTVTSTLGEPFDIFAEQRVTFADDGSGEWVISGVEVVQDGWLGEGFGCVPEEYSDVAVELAERFQTLSLGLDRDPPAALPSELLEISSDDLEEILEFGRQDLVSSGFYSDSPVEVSLEAVGLNFRFASADGPAVRVDSCVTYPEGQDLKLVGSDEVVESALGPGGSQGVSVDVLVREGFVGEVVAVSPIASGVC